MTRSFTLVTGGAGGIGIHLVRDLARRGIPVRVLDNFSSGTRGNLALLQQLEGVEIVEGDVKDAATVNRALEGVDFVWHLSANPDIRKGTVETDLDLNEGPVATRTLLQGMRTKGVHSLAFSSSSVVYGFPKVFPTPEDYGPLLPESLYGASKLACEGLLSSFAHTFGMRAWIFRFANIVGPGATHGVMYDFVQKLRKDPTRLEVLGDGRQSKGYLWVTDCVAAMVHCTERSQDTVNVFNLAPGDRISVAEIAQVVVDAFGGRARIEYTGGSKGWAGDIPQQLLAIGKLQATGFRNQYTSRQAVEMQVRAFLEG